MAHWEAGEDLRRGGILQSGLGLAALGVGAALVGAFIVGPVLKAKEAPDPARKVIAEARHAGLRDLPGEDEIRDGIDRAASNARRSLADEVERAIAEPKRSRRDEDAERAAKEKRKADASEEEEDTEEPAVTVRETPKRQEPAAKGDSERSGREKAAEREKPADRPAEEIIAEPAPRRGSTAAATLRSARPSDRAAPSVPAAAATTTAAVTRAAAAALRSTRPESPERARTGTPASKSPSGDDSAASGASPATGGGPVYRIRTGLFDTREGADERRARLAASGIPATVIKRGSYYTVLAGSYRQKENADRVVEMLHRQQLSAEITVR